MRLIGILAAVCCLVALVACGGSSSTTSTITLVGASCNPTSITSGQTSQCTSSVSGTGNFSSVVTWTASGNGTITPAGGVFTAETVPFTTQVTITATSTQDSTKTGSTVITVQTSGTVTSVVATCSPTTIQSGQQTACSAVVNGSGNFSPNVTWTASSGTINPITGVYSNTTPGTYTITASSQQNTAVTGTATVTVVSSVEQHAADHGRWRSSCLGSVEPAPGVRQWCFCHSHSLCPGNFELPNHRPCFDRYRLGWFAAARPGSSPAEN